MPKRAPERVTNALGVPPVALSVTNCYPPAPTPS